MLGVGTSLESWGDGKELVLRKYSGGTEHVFCLPLVACELGRASKQKLISLAKKKKSTQLECG